MKIAVAIATKDALSSAFVVLRGIEESIIKASEFGYDGVELALKNKEQIDLSLVKRLVLQYGLEVPVISTGQVFSDLNLYFTSADESVRNRVVEVFKGLIEVASEFGSKINIGRVRGFIPDGETYEIAARRFGDIVNRISVEAQKYNVELIMEPVNRYEINFINNLEDGAKLIESLEVNNLKLMPDLFHMNIEDSSIEGNLKKFRNYISYIHFADSNRLAPGWGHINFNTIVDTLNEIRYKGWISVEILPKPTPDEAAKQAINYLRKLIPKINL